ncbi:MAG: type II toxin-antitoxin system YafQ family toxin [Xenococcaceae cyanobacterium MO_234.B1]|nr:type II toxin-antitoxin system YafQ family toxin [Xenococcaceae cyanobacterium MO_234.B1]
MLIPQESTPFRRDLKRIKKRGKDLEKLKSVVQLLVEEQPLPERYRDHNLVGDWSGYRDCHIEPDWLLIYKIERDQGILTLVRTGTHSDLFKD